MKHKKFNIPKEAKVVSLFANGKTKFWSNIQNPQRMLEAWKGIDNILKFEERLMSAPAIPSNIKFTMRKKK